MQTCGVAITANVYLPSYTPEFQASLKGRKGKNATNFCECFLGYRNAIYLRELNLDFYWIMKNILGMFSSIISNVYGKTLGIYEFFVPI